MLTGIRFAKQLKFHPLLYLHAMASQASELGAQIFENTEISEFGGRPHHAMANDHRIDFDEVVIATHMPMQGNRSTAVATLFQTKLAAYSTYAIVVSRQLGTDGGMSLRTDELDESEALRNATLEKMGRSEKPE